VELGAGLGVAQLGDGAGAGAGVGAAIGAAGFAAGAGFFFGALFFAATFFFGAAAFLADFFADFLAFFADFFDVFLADFFADFFFAATTFFFLAFLDFFFFPLAIVVLLLPPNNVYRASLSRPAYRARPIDQFDPGRGPPVAQSRSSIVCTTGTDVPPAICTMHPILPAAIMSGSTIAMLATFRSRNLFAMSGWRML
jgi:hypothetical protein